MLPFEVMVEVLHRPSCFGEQSVAEFAHCRVFSFTFTNKLLVVCKTKFNCSRVGRHLSLRVHTAFLLSSPCSVCRGESLSHSHTDTGQVAAAAGGNLNTTTDLKLLAVFERVLFHSYQ